MLSAAAKHQLEDFDAFMYSGSHTDTVMLLWKFALLQHAIAVESMHHFNYTS